MAIDKIFNDGNVDGIADNIFNAVNNSVSEVKQMQQRKAAENAQMVVQSLKKIDTDIREKYDNVTNTLEKRIITIKDGRDGIDGKDGRDGKNGKDGRDGKDGKQGIQGLKGQDGIDGLDGVSVANANIDFDGSLIIALSNGQEINVGEVVSSDLADKIQVISTMSTNGAVAIKDEGTVVSSGVKSLNFVGTNITATTSGDDVTVTVTGGSGTGTVTSVAATVPTFLSVTGSPITTSGTLAISLSGTALPVANGGTGITSFGTGVATFLGTPSSANLAAAVTDETGSGSLVFATSPTLVTPILGTPSSGTLTSCTGLPISTGVSGLGTGIATALAVNVGTAGAPVVNGGALGTPSSGTVTNLTGTASININGTVGATTASSGAFTTLSATGVTTVQAGTAALPAITTTGDTNTGIFFPAADTIAFSEGGVEAMRIDSAGNLGLGVTPSALGSFYKAIQISSTAPLALVASGDDSSIATNAYVNNAGTWFFTSTSSYKPTRYTQYLGQHQWHTATASGSAGDTISFTQTMTLDASGNLGVGATSPAARLEVSKSENGETGAIIRNATNGSNAGALLKFIAGTDFGQIIRFPASHGAKANQLYITNVGTTSPITFATQDTERVRIDSDGNVGIGTASPSSRLSVAGNITLLTASPTISTALNDNFDIKNTNAGGQVRIFSGNSLAIECNSGQAITLPNLAGAGTRAVNANASGTLSAASDSRLKQEVEGQTLPSLAEVMKLEVKAYKWLDDIEVRGADAAVEIGFFADQVAPIIPSAAPMGRDGYYGFYDRSVIAALVNAIKEQQALITQLTARITALETA